MGKLLSEFKDIKTMLLLVIACCLIIRVIQGFGVGTQDVYVSGGDIDATVSGSVNVDGDVSVTNTVSVSIDEVLGKDNKKYYYNGY